MLCGTAESLFAAQAGSEDFHAGQAALLEAGMASLLQPEASGGFGGDWGDAFAVIRLAGWHALAQPLGEDIVARSALSGSGGGPPEGLLGLPDLVEGSLSGTSFTGTLRRVPWGRHCEAVLARIGSETVLVQTRDRERIDEACNLAGEVRDDLVFSRAPALRVGGSDPRVLGAFVRVAQMAGALDAALAMTIEHANARKQFGRPLAKFQAVQQSLAIAACEAAAVNTAGQAAALALDAGEAEFEVGAAKLRANKAVGIVAGIVHQVHGAIGFTAEYGLHPLTRRLMAWRSEFGGDHAWAVRLGRSTAALGADAFWAEMTRRGDRVSGEVPESI